MRIQPLGKYIIQYSSNLNKMLFILFAKEIFSKLE
jgi:hypothetical protein